MAAGDATIVFSNGEWVSLYWAGSDAISTIVPVSKSNLAASTNPKMFSVTSDCSIADIWCTTGNTTGEVEIVANGKRTGVRIPMDKRWVFSQAGREAYVPYQIRFRKGVIYQFMNTIVQT